MTNVAERTMVRHYKGGHYVIIGTVEPFFVPYDALLESMRSGNTFIAKHTEELNYKGNDQRGVLVYYHDGKVYADEKDYLVIYQDVKSGKLWARPYDMFWEENFIDDDGNTVEKRFTIVKTIS